MLTNSLRIISVGVFLGLAVIVLGDFSGKNLHAPRLALIGEFGEKKYYSEPGPYDWVGAEAFCEVNGMTLIAIETAAEHSYLREVLVGEAGNKYYWTGGIEPFYKFTEYFEWSNNGKKVQNLGGFQAFKAGVSFYPAASYTLISFPTSTRFPILCQKLSSASSSLQVKVREVDPNASVQIPHEHESNIFV